MALATRCMPTSIIRPPSDVYWSFEVLHRLFPWLKQQVTELDMSVYLSTDNTSNYGANGGSVPESVVAEQGWLYKDYFDVFKALARRHELQAVTFWGIGGRQHVARQLPDRPPR